MSVVDTMADRLRAFDAAREWQKNEDCPFPVDLALELRELGVDPDELLERFREGDT